MRWFLSVSSTRTLGSGDVLATQEAQIAWLDSECALNVEIAARLFLCAHTVEYHPHKVFGKLGITNRAQLVRALAGPGWHVHGEAAGEEPTCTTT